MLKAQDNKELVKKFFLQLMFCILIPSIYGTLIHFLVAVVDYTRVLGKRRSRVHFLLYSPPHEVVGELEFYIALAGLDQTVFAIPDLRPTVAGQHIAVGIVGRLLGVDSSILVQRIGGIVISKRPTRYPPAPVPQTIPAAWKSVSSSDVPPRKNPLLNG
ncbi:MAG: hypothetical protein IJI59_09710 [Clostridia bacterium]|nr:hypothetical protein [Clostridia bacterium]